MKTLFNKYAKFGIAFLFLACSTEDDITADWIETNEADPVVTGTVDLTKYVAVGNSLTAGFQDGALYPEGQELSYPSILGGQFALAGGGEFNNPNIIAAEDGTGRISIDLQAALAFLNEGEGTLADALITADASPLTASTLSVNNFGVPGARAIDVVTPGYGAFNSFFGAFQSDGTASIVGDAAAANGSFFSLWIGSNDVLGYATNGGVNDVFDPFDNTTITGTTEFSAAISGALDALTANGAEGVILNIPPVTTVPYFQVATTLGGGVELVPLTDQALVDQLNGAFNVPFPSPIAGVDPGYNTLLDIAASLDPTNAELAAEVARRKVTWELGANAPIITDESLTVLDVSAAAGFPPGSIVLPQIREASATNLAGIGDVFPLPALFVIGTPQSDESIPGVSAPLGDEFTLTEEEQIKVITATATFNGIIAGQVAAREGVTLVDLGPLFADVNGFTAAQSAGLGLSAAAIAVSDGIPGKEVSGISLVPISFDQSEIFNSIFSADFVHPNPRGAALVTNEIIDVLNATYGSEIPLVNPLAYPGINVPF